MQYIVLLACNICANLSVRNFCNSYTSSIGKSMMAKFDTGRCYTIVIWSWLYIVRDNKKNCVYNEDIFHDSPNYEGCAFRWCYLSEDLRFERGYLRFVG